MAGGALIEIVRPKGPAAEGRIRIRNRIRLPVPEPDPAGGPGFGSGTGNANQSRIYRSRYQRRAPVLVLLGAL